MEKIETLEQEEKSKKKFKKALKKFVKRNETVKSIVIIGDKNAEIIPIAIEKSKDCAEDLIAIGLFLSEYELIPESEYIEELAKMDEEVEVAED